MLSLPRPASKEYTERATQTDALLDESPPPFPLEVSGTEQNEAGPPDDDSRLPLAHSRSSTLNDSAYNDSQVNFSFDSISSEGNRSMTTTTRVYKRPQLPLNRPSTLADNQPSPRIFSLPEATPRFRMKNVISKKTARIVSGPASTPRNVCGDLDISTNAGDPFGSEGEEYTRVRVKSQATDVPYTPSVPSSPDSVVIIANNSNQLSSEFLRPRPDEVSSPESDDEDWLSWAESPPRPIPALHGPLSLPYARCPSGAEGTIIEEPESLPRVIWGLGTDESKGCRPFHHASAAPPPAKKGLPVVQVEQKSKHGPKQSGAEITRAVNTHAPRRAPQPSRPSITRPPPQQPPPPPDFILKHSEPIDLGRLVSHTPDTIHHMPSVDYGLKYDSRWQTSFQHQLPTPELVHDLSPELQAMLFAQERLKHRGLSPPSLATPHDLSGALGSLSVEPSLSLLESLKSSRSPIVLDDLTAPHGLNLDASSHMSALGIAQKYRQHQLYQGLLPTPPNSSSPLWSSSFSPYQGGILSPRLLAAAGLSQLNPAYTSSQTAIPRFDASSQALRASLGIIGNQLLGGQQVNLNNLAPAAQINAGASHKLPPRLAAEYARRRGAVEASNDLHQSEHDLRQHLASPGRRVMQSPIVPKPPPNTPHATKRLDTGGQGPVLATPSSPTEPRNSQSVGLSQHARSIPLTKLMQRRLSIVPEEEHAPGAETVRASPYARAHTQGSGVGASGLHLYLAPTGRPHVNASALDLLGNNFGTQYGVGDAESAPGQTHNPRPSVRLPGVPGRTSGPGGRAGAQVVKEALGRQGSGNVNKDGGQRSDSGRGRGQKRGGRGRRGRGGGLSAGGALHGTERVDGGMMVKS
ncbi:hypothetical protein C8Q78DRAFT_1183639 [Trametes maxima]|nr:hypothetical protein C8Q78DRAFT_1183639 [Trametes maxima]